MKRLLILIPAIGCLVGCSGLGTQVGEEEFSTIPLQQKKPPPSFDKTFSSPSRGRLCLSYIAPGGANGNVWLLLFERKIPPKNRPLNTRFEAYNGSQGPVTLLVVESNPASQKKAWCVTNSIPLGVVSKLRKDYIALRWLEPLKQKGPVLFVSKLDGGVDGSSELIAFPDGWNQSNPVRQTYGNSMGWDDGAKYNFGSVDAKGFLCITETRSSYTHSPPGETTSTNYHFWDGTGWKSASP